jgi:glucuronate isomerase
MKPFLDDDFLLESDTAAALYHEVAAKQPIIDFHCHLPPEQIASDHRFENLTRIWLDGDHYKWRAMRADGVSENLITGDAPDWQKFEAWARTVPHTLRNPLYHWTHLELRFPFGVKELLGPRTARAIYEHCNALLASEGFSTQGLLRKYGVSVVCSTDDPTDDLSHHRKHAANTGAFTRLLPTWRPDRVLAVERLEEWNAWIDRLSASADTWVRDYRSLLEALKKRHDLFHELGCRASDHGLERLYAADYSARDVELAFARARSGHALDAAQIDTLRSALLHDMALWHHERGWVQQFHLGALRNNNTRGLRRLGRDSGYDAIGDFPQADALVRFLDRLDQTNQLARTILYNLNPADNEVLASVLGSFQDGSTPGKLQLGSAWWFLDQLDGMRKQIDALSNLGLLARFVGMLTDSRSFLSYSRHEYFRRLLCNVLAEDVERGLVPNDRELLDELVKNVCHDNARDYFRFGLTLKG